MVKLFISSVQREFEAERREIAAYIRQDAVMGRFFEPFLFEELPAKDVSAQQAYLTEVAETDVYLGLFGVDYGYEDAEGVSPFGLFVWRFHVVLVSHPQRRAVAHDMDVRAAGEGEKARALRTELAGLRLDLDAWLEDELQVRRARERRDDPRRRHFVHDEPRDAGRERGLERRGGIGGVEPPPRGARLGASSCADLRHEVGTFTG